MAQFDNPINPRAWSRADIGAPHLNQEQLQALSGVRQFLYRDLGINVGEDGSVPISEGTYVPRLFVLAKTQTHHDTTMYPNNAGAPVGSPEFWRQVQLGNVYAYPTGETRPVQLQLQFDEGTNRPRLVYSQPVTPENVPAPPDKPLGFFKRLAWLATFGRAFNKQRLEYKRRDSSKTSITTKLRDFAEARQDAARKEAAAKAVEEAAARRRKVEMVRTPYENGMKLMTQIYQPEPQYDKNRDANFVKGGLYKKSEFDTLVRYGKDKLDLSKLRPGNQAVTPEEFSAVAAVGIWQPDVLKTAMKKDPYGERTLAELGIAKDQTPFIATSNKRSFLTTDMFIVGGARGNNGAFYETTVNAGRKLAVEAFQDYANGKPEKLGKLLSSGAMMVAKGMATLGSAKISDQDRGTLAVADKVLSLLERDPKLRAEAAKAGMTPAHLQTLQCGRALMKMDQKACQAEADLLEASLNGKELAPEKKAELAKTVLKARIACSKIAMDNQAESPEYTRVNNELMKRVALMAPHQAGEREPETLPDPGPGKIWSESYTNMWTGLKAELQPTPPTLLEVDTPAFQRHLDRLATEIISQHKLKDMTTEDLHEVLTNSGDKLQLSNSIVSAENALNSRNQPQAEQNQPVAHNVSVADRARQFEQAPQVGGRQP